MYIQLECVYSASLCTVVCRCVLKMDHHCPWSVALLHDVADNNIIMMILGQGQQLRGLLQLQVFCAVSVLYCCSLCLVLFDWSL